MMEELMTEFCIQCVGEFLRPRTPGNIWIWSQPKQLRLQWKITFWGWQVSRGKHSEWDGRVPCKYIPMKSTHPPVIKLSCTQMSLWLSFQVSIKSCLLQKNILHHLSLIACSCLFLFLLLATLIWLLFFHLFYYSFFMLFSLRQRKMIEWNWRRSVSRRNLKNTEAELLSQSCHLPAVWPWVSHLLLWTSGFSSVMWGTKTQPTVLFV